MKKIQIIIFILMCTSCTLKKDVYNSGIFIDIENAIAEEVSFYEFFEDISIVPLETTHECLIRDVMRIIFYKNAYYIFDRQQKTVFVFYESGEFKYKIASIGRGPGEYLDVDDFTINPFMNSIDLLSPRGLIYRYNLEDGSFIETITLINLRAVHMLKYVTQDIIALYQKFEEYKFILYSLSQNKIINQQFELPGFVSRELPTTRSKLFYVFKDSLHFFHPYTNSIYILEDNNLIPKISWDFGRYNFNLSDLESNKGKEYFYSNYFNESKTAFFFDSVVENDCQIQIHFIFDRLNYTLIFYKESYDYIILREFSEGILFPTYTSPAGDYIFGLYPPNQLKFFVKEWMLVDAEKEKLSLIKEDDNPVIIRYKNCTR